MNKEQKYYETLDKRSKEYRDYKKRLENAIDKKEAFVDNGLGDKVEKFTEKTGLKKIIKNITKDCGCDKRKEKLNKIRFRFPVVRCFTEEQYNNWSVSKDKTKWSIEDQKNILIPIYQQLFARVLKPMNCCIESYINDITRVYENY